MDSRHSIAKRECGKLFTAGHKRRIVGYHKSAGAKFAECRKGLTEITLLAGMQDVQIASEGSGRCSQVRYDPRRFSDCLG